MNNRPLSVTVIGWIFVAVGVVGFVFHATEVKAQHPFQSDAVWVLLLRLLAIVCGVFMLRRSNWARWLSLAWIAFHVILSLHSLQASVVHSVLLVVCGYFLFRPEATAYFRAARTEGM
jgi:hypothetical protein